MSLQTVAIDILSSKFDSVIQKVKGNSLDEPLDKASLALVRLLNTKGIPDSPQEFYARFPQSKLKERDFTLLQRLTLSLLDPSISNEEREELWHGLVYSGQAHSVTRVELCRLLSCYPESDLSVEIPLYTREQEEKFYKRKKDEYIANGKRFLESLPKTSKLFKKASALESKIKKDISRFGEQRFNNLVERLKKERLYHRDLSESADGVKDNKAAKDFLRCLETKPIIDDSLKNEFCISKDEEAMLSLLGANIKKRRDMEVELLWELVDKVEASSDVTDEEAEDWFNESVIMKNVDADNRTKKQLKRFYRLVNGKIGKIKLVKVSDNRKRAGYEPIVKSIFLTNSADCLKLDTLWHELAHCAEDSNIPSVKACSSFVKERSNGRQPESLYNFKRTEQEKMLYGEQELAYPDNFIHPYIGKIYPNDSAAEVLSMFFTELGNAVEDFTTQYPLFNDREFTELCTGILRDKKREYFSASKKSTSLFTSDLKWRVFFLQFKKLDKNNEGEQLTCLKYFREHGLDELQGKSDQELSQLSSDIEKGIIPLWLGKIIDTKVNE